MYTLADKAISEEEFSRAVTICTGRRLSPHVVHTVFQIFDNDGDGLLSYQVLPTASRAATRRWTNLTFAFRSSWP